MRYNMDDIIRINHSEEDNELKEESKTLMPPITGLDIAETPGNQTPINQLN